jgi:hypothetical protein
MDGTGGLGAIDIPKVIDLTSLHYLMNIIEGMGRGLETDINCNFTLGEGCVKSAGTGGFHEDGCF